MNEAKYLPVTGTPLQPRSQPGALCTSAHAEGSPPGEHGRTRTRGNTRAYDVVRAGQKEVRGMDDGILCASAAGNDHHLPIFIVPR